MAPGNVAGTPRRLKDHAAYTVPDSCAPQRLLVLVFTMTKSEAERGLCLEIPHLLVSPYSPFPPSHLLPPLQNRFYAVRLAHLVRFDSQARQLRQLADISRDGAIEAVVSDVTATQPTC